MTDAYKGKGVRAHNRSRLQIAVSADEGKTWLTHPAGAGCNRLIDNGYSAITEGPDGNIYVSYSHNDEKGYEQYPIATIKRI